MHQRSAATSRDLLEGPFPGDELFIDGIMDALVEKKKAKLLERKQLHQLAELTPLASNCTLPKEGYKGRPCAAGCTDRGNCNLEEGRCECPIGVGGGRLGLLLPSLLELKRLSLFRFCRSCL